MALFGQNRVESFYKHNKLQLVELPVDANSTKTQINFPTQNFLRDYNIISIEAYSNVNIPNAPATQNPLVSEALFENAFLTLYGNDPDTSNGNAAGLWIQEVPLTSFRCLQNFIANPYNSSLNGLFLLDERMINWEKSYIQFGLPLPGNLPAFSFLFSVGYTGRGRI